MTTEKYISHSCAVLLIASSIALAFMQVINIDTVAKGTLMYIAQAFLLAGSIFGLDYYIQKMTALLKNRDSKPTVAAVVLLALILPIGARAQLIHVDKKVYRSLYDVTLQSPRQVSWVLHASDLGNAKRNQSWRFVQDVPDTMAVADHYDFSHTGYDRGHLCPAADRSGSADSMRATFAMSNICPQVPVLNRGAWKDTEVWCRDAACLYDSVSVLVVPVWISRDTTFIGRHRVAVPHAFFKTAWLTSSDSILKTWFFFNH